MSRRDRRLSPPGGDPRIFETTAEPADEIPSQILRAARHRRAARPIATCRSRLERMIHFVPPHVDKLRAKVGELARQVDVVLGNLEDAIPIEAKAAAREGFIAMASATISATTGLWARVNALNSPWFLDDMTRIVGEIGDRLDVVMLPKVEGPWDIHFIDQYLGAAGGAPRRRPKPILVHAILETAEGVNNVAAIAGASPRMHGMSLGPADLAASRAMKTTRVGGGHPDYRVLADAGAPRRGAPRRPAGPLALHDRAHGRRLRGQWREAVLRPLRRFLRSRGLRERSSATPSCWAAPAPGRCIPARSRSPRRSSRPTRPRSPSPTNPRRHARRVGRGDDRRQDAGRRDLETGAGSSSISRARSPPRTRNSPRSTDSEAPRRKLTARS